MNELIAALRRDRMDEFKTRFRRVDVLIVDDVQFLAGTRAHPGGVLPHLQLPVRRPPADRPHLGQVPEGDPRPRGAAAQSRFEWGLIADIQPPDIETRVAILEKKAESEGIDLPHDVAIFLATNIDSNVRELEGSLTRLGAFASLNKCPDHRRLRARGSAERPARSRRPGVTIESIQKVVCEFFRIRPTDLRSKRRTRTIAVPRQVAMYLCRRHTNASFPVIGDRFGGRDHSTVIHATRSSSAASRGPDLSGSRRAPRAALGNRAKCNEWDVEPTVEAVTCGEVVEGM